MPTRLLIQNTEPTTKIAGAAAQPLTIKQTGGGPSKSMQLPPGGEIEVVLDEGQKVTIQQGEGED